MIGPRPSPASPALARVSYSIAASPGRLRSLRLTCRRNDSASGSVSRAAVEVSAIVRLTHNGTLSWQNSGSRQRPWSTVAFAPPTTVPTAPNLTPPARPRAGARPIAAVDRSATADCVRGRQPCPSSQERPSPWTSAQNALAPSASGSAPAGSIRRDELAQVQRPPPLSPPPAATRSWLSRSHGPLPKTNPSETGRPARGEPNVCDPNARHLSRGGTRGVGSAARRRRASP